MNVLSARAAIVVFLAFAFAYFLSALIRAITATLSPILTMEFALQARDLGLLAGAYFLGFAATQLPLGAWLDRYGPKRVVVCLLAVALTGCLAFSAATTFTGLLAARVLCGVGLSACLMAPLTGYRRWFSPATQMGCNSWMLMAGSLGTIASTLPVQWLTPLVGWRPIFMGLASLLLLATVLIAWRVPSWPHAKSSAAAVNASYAEVWRHPFFRAMAPVGFFGYGGLMAVQALWAAPWMVTVAAYSPLQAAIGLFWINVAMSCTYWCWGLLGPWLAKRGIAADRLVICGLPVSHGLLAIIIVLPGYFPQATAVMLTLYCMASSFVTPAQPAVGMAFAPEVAGRALSAYNLVIFVGAFVIQWGIGLVIDGLMALGASRMQAFQMAFAAFLGCCIASYLHFLRASRHSHNIRANA